MNLLNLKKIIKTFIFLLFTTHIGFAQDGNLTIDQDSKIDKLLTIKKDMNTSDTDTDRYKIQVYSGNSNSEAEKAKTKIKTKLNELPAIITFETPNYKVWVGNFRNRLEADRALLKVQKDFKSAFVFKPKKLKE